MSKQIDITKYEDFIEAGFKECSGCGWAFDPAHYDSHNCDEMNKPAHNHIEEPCKKGCPLFGVSTPKNEEIKDVTGSLAHPIEEEK